MQQNKKLILALFTSLLAVVLSLAIVSKFFIFKWQILAILILTLFFKARSLFNQKGEFGLLALLVFTVVILTLITSSGGVSSPLFFLVYFLLFSLSITVEPLVSLFLSVVLVVYFILTSLTLNSKLNLEQFISIFSLPLITPLAVYFGKTKQRLYSQQRQIADLKEKEVQTVIFLTTAFISHLRSIKTSINNLDFQVKQKLNNPLDWKTIKHQLKRLETLTNRLKQFIKEGL